VDAKTKIGKVQAIVVVASLLASFFVGFASPAKADDTSLLITGVIDGPLTGGVPKAIEFYVINDIADLSTYGFGSANNGGGSDGEEFTFPAVAATAGTFIYVASETIGFTDFFGFAPDYTSSAASINGDDAIELFENGVVVDVFGDINVDGTGEPWEYMDGWAYRVDGTGPDGDTFVLANWTFSGPNALDGETTNATAATPFPIGTYSPTITDMPPTITSTTPANGETDVAVDASIEVNFSENVTVTGSWYEIGCTNSGIHTALVSGGPQNFTLDPDDDFISNDECTVTVFASQVADHDGTPDNMEADYIWSFDVVEVQVCGDPATFIHDIQGNGASSPEVGNTHVIEGVVVGDFQDTSTELSGFFLQEEDGDADADSTTSEGIFVYDHGFMDVNEGDVVRVMGDVTEYYELTELNNVSGMLICDPGPVATAAAVTLPIADTAEWEWYEGMLINIPQTLYATGNYAQGRYGEVDLSVGDRLDTPTNVVLPGAPALALQELNDRSRIQLEDGSTAENPPIAPYMGLDNTLRAGDTIPELTGVLHYSFGAYELHPTEAVDFTRVNTRDASPDPVGGVLKVASFNVLNYFSTLDGSGPICGPTGGMDCRGADNAFEFERQRAKIIAAIVAMDADVIGLMELENHPTDAALQDLVNGLNDIAGAGTYAYVDTGTIGTDAIKVAFIYKPGAVTPLGSPAILDSSVDPAFIDTRNRPALAQTFQHTTDEIFTVVVNHLKSKGSACEGDPDTGDGQGNCNLTRTAAATALVNWLEGDPTGSGDADFMIIGDLNSYALEDPITAIKTGGYTDLVQAFGGTNAYSYVFMGQSGYLDHALASSALTARVMGATEWHINADEPPALDYNDYNQLELYSPDQFCASDHDPVIVGICDAIPPTVNVQVTPDTLWPPNHKYVTVNATVDAFDATGGTTLTFVSVTSNEPDNGPGDGNTTNDIVIVDDFTVKPRAERSGTGDGRIYTITYAVTDACGNSTVATATVTVPHDQGKGGD
jgi:predicted extracellular nuclease